ncbi:hypothetical protein HY489_01310 [Candidatus Woesearchaeota archaeon]|nr:hypothetical protein [Candidatus Woesearchaeota archaeon]
MNKNCRTHKGLSGRDLELPRQRLGRLAHTRVQTIFIVYAPSNKGLQFVREQGLEQVMREFASRLESARGEDIAAAVSGSCCPAIGITGEDLFEEFRSKGGSSVEIISRLNLAWKGPYANSVFGLPALCVLGTSCRKSRWYTKGTEGNLPVLDRRTVAIPNKYEAFIKRRFIGQNVEWIVLEGQVEVTCARDPSIDYAIDIVLSGRTCERENIGIIAKLFESDGVIVANQTFLRTYGQGD